MEKVEIINAIEEIRKFKTETNKIEVKTALKGFPKKCYDTFSSFSNKYGGIILFGISENNAFKTEGVYNVKDLQKQITNLCNDSMNPKLRPDILILQFEGKNILAVKLEEIPQNQKPCYYKPKGLKAGSYIRNGDRDDLMTDYEIYALESYNDHIFEDTRPTKRSSVDDLNINELKEYIDKIKKSKPNFSKNSYEKNLKLCGITDNTEKNVYPTLAGTMIFGDYPQSFYPQLFIACVVIPGYSLGDVGDLGERFIDNKRIEGTIEEMLEGAMNFLRRNMRTRVIIDANGNRTDRPEYPIEALREAIANALIHRDYSTQTENAYISVYMYEDRIEILNPGALYGINKLEKLGTDTIMESRNPTIVRILEEKGSVIENRHSGIPTMIREMKKLNLPEPEFYEERGSFKVIFRNFRNEVLTTNAIPSEHVATQGGAESGAHGGVQSGSKGDSKCGSNSGLLSGAQSTSKGGAQSTSQGGAQNINKKIILIKILEFCKEPKTAVEIRSYLGIKSKRYVSEELIRPLIKGKLLGHTNKKSINARNQKYITIKKYNNIEKK